MSFFFFYGFPHPVGDAAVRLFFFLFLGTYAASLILAGWLRRSLPTLTGSGHRFLCSGPPATGVRMCTDRVVVRCAGDGHRRIGCLNPPLLQNSGRRPFHFSHRGFAMPVIHRTGWVEPASACWRAVLMARFVDCLAAVFLCYSEAQAFFENVAVVSWMPRGPGLA